MKRRTMLARIGAAGAVGALAGCIDRISGSGDDGNGDDDGNGGDENGTDDGNGDGGANGDDDGGNGDDDDASIDGRLHNESDEERTFAVVIRDADDEVVADEEWDVEAESTENVPAFGKPGEPRTFEVSVGEAGATETFEFDVEAAPGQKDGYVDVTYTADGELEIEFTPADDDEGGDENDDGDENGDGDADGDDGEPDGDAESASVDGTRIDTLGSDCGGENEATIGLDGGTVTIRGRISAPNPCHEAVLESVEDGAGLTVTIGTVDASEPDEVCAQCVGEVEYEVTVEFDGEPSLPLVVEHDVVDGPLEVARRE